MANQTPRGTRVSPVIPASAAIAPPAKAHEEGQAPNRGYPGYP
ncbi:MAG: hypothetical protein ABSH20_01425 [Tepidisphaeraceae bacterium]